MKHILLSLLLAASFSAHADALQERAFIGQAGDVATTTIALTAVSGLAEANPLGIVALVGKGIALKYADGLPPGEERDSIHRSLSAFGFGASVNNGCFIIGALTGGGGMALCPLLGIATGLIDLNITASMVYAAPADIYISAQ